MEETRKRSRSPPATTAPAAAAAPAKPTTGLYIPPHKLAQMAASISDKSSKEYQRITWDALRKSINGLINKVLTNIWHYVHETGQHLKY